MESVVSVGTLSMTTVAVASNGSSITVRAAIEKINLHHIL